MTTSRSLNTLLAVALVLVFGGGLLAWNVQTAGGTIEIRDVRFMGTNGTMMSALLYIPPGVTAEKPAPGILAVHGYINSRETQDGFAIEFARRGYVVLALDQTGHGYSDPPAFANGFGGPDGLRYLRSLDIVDKENIGLEGHSMGGWTNLAAAIGAPEDYKSMALVGSSTGAPFAADGTATWPRNVAVIFSEWDEFSQLMWAVDTGKQIVNSDKLKTLFDTTDAVEIGKVYGSIEEGTARVLYVPRGTHPNDHISTEAIGNALDWMAQTLQGGNGLPSSDQVWYWKEIFTFVAFIGAMLFLFPLGALLLNTAYFSDLRQPMPAAKPATGNLWWAGAVLTVVIPALTFFWLQNNGNQWFPASALWPQTITTGIMTWAVGNGLITLVLFLVWHYSRNRADGATPVNYGLSEANGYAPARILKSALLAICIMAGFYVLLVLSDTLFETDFRLWVLAFKPMSGFQFQMSLAYLLPFAFFFLISGTALNGQLRRPALTLGRAMLLNAALLSLGIILMLLIQYIPLMFGGVLPLGESLLTIVGIQFVPLLILVGCIQTYFFHKTGRVYTGAFLSALFITIYIVAGQAVQFAF